jgi:hypothetical protein
MYKKGQRGANRGHRGALKGGRGAAPLYFRLAGTMLLISWTSHWPIFFFPIVRNKGKINILQKVLLSGHKENKHTYKISILQGASCRTVVLWFNIVVSNHNATDSVVEKSCNLPHRFFLRTLGMYFSTFQHCSSKYLLLPKSRHILLPICIFKLTLNPL